MKVQFNDRFKFRVWNNTYKQYLRVVNVCVPDNVSQLFVGDDEVIEQCTGLKDKNGNLIYEGDVVKTKTGSIYEIKWVETGFFAYDDGFINAIDFLECPEIIGNIHEQKDAA